MSGDGRRRSVTTEASARLLVALIAIVLGIGALIGTRSMSQLGSVFPTSAGALLLLGGLVSTVLALRERRTSRARDMTVTQRGTGAAIPRTGRGEAYVSDADTERAPDTGVASIAALQRVSGPRWVAVVIALLAWALLLDELGFLITSSVGMPVIAIATWRGPVTTTSVLAHVMAFAGLLGGFYAIMRFVLRIAVP